MVEIIEMNAEIVPKANGKIEDDRSYKHDSGVSSGGDSTGNAMRTHSSEYDYTDTKSSDGSWIKVENEVVDPVSFNPPCLQSTDLAPKSNMWDISSIENMGLVPKSIKGMNGIYETFRQPILNKLISWF